MVSVNLVNLLFQRPMASNVSEAMRGGGAAGQACFVKFYFSRNCAFYCFPAVYNGHDKELVELQVETCDVIPSEENLVRCLKREWKFFYGKHTVLFVSKTKTTLFILI